jgi:hypothetical protein
MLAILFDSYIFSFTNYNISFTEVSIFSLYLQLIYIYKNTILLYEIESILHRTNNFRFVKSRRISWLDHLQRMSDHHNLKGS